VIEVIYVKAKFITEINEWLAKHCPNRYYVAVPRHVVSNTAVFAFYEEGDATMFKLRYGL
jgi:hypothetical protein